METLEVSQQRSDSKHISVLDIPGQGHGSQVREGGPGAFSGRVIGRPGRIRECGPSPDGGLWALPDGKEALMESRERSQTLRARNSLEGTAWQD